MRLLAVLLAVLAVAGTAQALITTSPTRFDLPETDGDTVLEGEVVIRNRGEETTRVEAQVTALEAEAVVVEPTAVVLAPGEEALVRIRVAIAANASGGRHDVRILFLERPATGAGAAQGQSGLHVPFVFRVTNLKLGGLTVADVAEGENATAATLVQNFLPAPAGATLTTVILDDAAREVARVSQAVPTIERNATMPASAILPTSALPAGVYSVRATATNGGYESNSITMPLLIGEKRLTIGDVAVQPPESAGGDSAFTAVVENPGKVPLTAIVTFRIFDAQGRLVRSVDAAPAAVAPGGRVPVNATSALPPGDYRVEAAVTWRGGEANTTAASLTVVAPPQPDEAPGPWLYVAVGAVFAVAVGVILWRGRR